MSSIYLMFVFAAVVVILFLLPIVIVYFSWTKTRYWKYPITLIFGAYCFQWWDAFYPGDDYFKSEFKLISGLDLPSSAEVIHKHATYPNLHGDFHLCFVIKIAEEDLKFLLTKTDVEPANQVRSCNSKQTYKLVSKGKNSSDYDFMSWYVTEEGFIWGYYAQY